MNCEGKGNSDFSQQDNVWQCSLMFTGEMQGQVQLRFESVRNSGALWKRKNMLEQFSSESAKKCWHTFLKC